VKGVNSFGFACNSTSAVPDSTQCPTNFGSIQLYCACNNTCAYVTNGGVVSGSCGEWTYINFQALLINAPTVASTADAEFSGNQNHLADYYCCNGCGSTAQGYFATQTGVTIDCQSKTISKQQICDNTYTNVPYLQNCAKYVGAEGGASVAVASVSTMVLLAVATFLLS